jgi:hypothetical protein
MPWPVPDLAGFLTGAWDLRRRMTDRRADAEGELTGTALFYPAPGGLHYAERGTLSFGEYRGEATRRYWFGLDGAGMADIRFDDGRPFHRLDLSSGAADVTHACPPDAYRGRYEAVGPDRWTVTWTVEGPRKRLFITTEYLRTATA